jgi:DNA repair protein RecN (Recombination protein N)
MPNAKWKVEQEPITLGTSGADQVRILFSANKGVGLQDLKTAASGGEFSRLLLCLKYVLAGKTNLPTLIFDEIDTGISGEIALRVGRLMARMAERHQLIVITHMPQIAAKGHRHYFVYKEEKAHRTVTHVRELAPQERLLEIAQMIGGANPSATALSSAKELMEGV